MLQIGPFHLLWAFAAIVKASAQSATESWGPAQAQYTGSESPRDIPWVDTFDAKPLDDSFDWAFLDSQSQAQDDLICNDKHSSKYDPLACWLWKVKVSIPNQSFKKSLVTVKVMDLSCSNFVVQSINSSYIPSNQSHEFPSIDLNVNGISASCTGKYHASGGASGKISLRATSEKEDQPAIHLTLDFNSSYYLPNATANTTTKYWMPVALSTQQCEADLKISDLHCAGSASAQIVNLFSRMIKGAVSSELNEILCPTIQEAVDPLATESILSTVRALMKYVSDGNESNIEDNLLPELDHLVSNTQRDRRLQAKPYSSVVDFEKDTPLFVKSLRSVNHFLDCFYGDANNSWPLEKQHNPNQFSCTGLVTKGFKGLFSTLLGSLANQVHLPIPKGLHKIQFKLPPYGRILLDVQDLHIRGLDGLDSLSLLSPMAKEDSQLSDFSTRIRAGEGVNVTADINMTIFAIPGGMIHGDPLHEVFHVHFNMSTFDAFGIVDLALRSDRFKYIQLGTILDSLPERIHPHTNSSHNSTVDRRCLLESVQSLQFKDMELQTIVDSVTVVPKFNFSSRPRRRRLSPLTDKLERGLDDVINHGIELILKEYQPLLTDSAAGFVKTELVARVNNWFEEKLNNTQLTDDSLDPSFSAAWMNTRTSFFLRDNDVCSSREDEHAPPHLVNFSSLGSLNRLNEYINKPSTLESINNALDNLAAKADRHKDSPMARSLMAWATGLDKSAIPGVSVQLRDLQIDDLGSVEHIDVLSPELDGLHLKNGFIMGIGEHTTAAGNTGGVPTVRASILVLYRPRNLSATINATLSLGDIYLDGGQILRFDMTRFRRLSLIELFQHGHCLIVPFQGHQIYNNHNVSRIGTLLANVSVGVIGDANFENFTTYMDTIRHPNAAGLITSLVGWILNTSQQGLNSATHSSFEQAEGYCTGGQKFGFDEDPPILNDGFVDDWLLPVLSIFGSLLVVSQAVFFCAHRVYRNRREDRVGSEGIMNQPLLPFENGEQEPFLEDDEKDGEAGPGETLVQSTVLSAFSRQAVPVFIVGTIVLLLSSNISSGATVDLRITWDDSREINLPAIFTFSLLNTARDMWQAKIYPLFFLVLIMSGIWPYTKLLLMLGAWTTPTHVLHPRTREKLLLALDALGKFALIDFLLFVLMMVAFRYHLNGTDNISLDVFVSPESGFYSFLAATCFSLMIGHFMVYYHRLSETRHLSLRRDESVALYKESVLDHNYVVGYSNEGEQRFRLSRRFRGVLLFTVLMAVILLAVGITQKSFKFVIGGIAGDVLGDHRTTYYSLLSLGSSMRRSVKNPSSVGIFALEIIYYFYAVVTPFSCLAILFILLLCPMTLPTQRVVLAMAEIANAWSAVEVFVIAIIASLLEISTFASFIVGDRCDLIKQILKEYFESAISDESDATCFTVRSSVENSCWWLVLGVLLNSLIVSVILRFAHCSVAERIESEMVSSLVQPSDDALNPEASGRPRTIAGLLSCGCFKSIFFETERRSGPHPRYGYLPQGMDTYSVAGSVNWQEEATLNEVPSTSPLLNGNGHSSPHTKTPSASVLETMRNAFD